METTAEIKAFEDRANSAGLKMADILRAANIDRSMWTRWKNGSTVPRLDNWRSMERAFASMAPSPERAAS